MVERRLGRLRPLYRRRVLVPWGQLVTISAKSGATGYCTTNGATPTTSSTVYSGPIALHGNETLQAIAVAGGFAASAIASGIYKVSAPAPVFTPAAGTYSGTQFVSISDVLGSATIHYTTEGSAPTKSSAAYSGPITVSGNETVKAIAVANGLANSPTAAASYKINVPTPTFTPAAGTYASPQSVTITDSVSNATIYYTTDGTAPSTSSAVYSAPISVNSNETLKAMAVASGEQNSAAGKAAYQIQ